MPKHASPVRALFLRLVLINGTVFVVGTLALALSPVTISSPILLTEIPVLVIGLALILVATTVLLRRSLAPLDALQSVMERVDLLRSRDRLPEDDDHDLARLITTFNAMLDRLEEQRSVRSAEVLAGQEAERRRIARELHDEIGQSLTAALLSLKRVVDRAPAALQWDLRQVQDTVRGSLDDVRQVARRLRPDVLEDLGLASALAALAAEFTEAAGVPVLRTGDPVPAGLTPQTELVLFRITQESLTNVARHADAEKVTVSLAAGPRALILTVLDDGRGGPHVEGAGIRGMRERALLVDGELTVSSPPGGGTLVTLVVPL
ncbi:sensor histidine kinase [Pseudonocardia oroxyli]|uniref:histidine kinase n=1 Tax=Pseudonocardia oroxyli TaxID=366584 RepID=A0A1G7FSZ4_PSEOR|nr:sensor histidine kinase [Pseudonocardia oroxyli]SDE79021.1 two-component system, NarL family, sensor histidine kinase UhpB [Pseudonocardia oroxyli]